MKLRYMLLFLMTFSLVCGSVSAQTDDQGNDDLERFTTGNALGKSESDMVFYHGARREAMPFQIQLVQTFGPATPNTFAPGAGIHLGYQVSDTIYLGLTSSAFFDGENARDDHSNYRYDDDEIYGQDGGDHTTSELDPMHLLELRVTPWDFGFYFSLGAMYRGKQTSTTTFKSEQRDIGDSEYTTGLEATVEYEEWYGAAMGIGFNYIFDSGFSIGTALNWGLNAQTPDVEVTSTASVDKEDLDHWKKQIRSNEKQIPYLYTISLGWAF